LVSHCAASPSKGSSIGGPCRGEAAARAVCVRPRALFRLQSSLEFVLRWRPPCRFAIHLRRPSTRPRALDEFAVWPSLSQSKPCAKSISIARDRASSPEFPRAPPLVGLSAATIAALSVASCSILSQRIRSNAVCDFMGGGGQSARLWVAMASLPLRMVFVWFVCTRWAKFSWVDVWFLTKKLRLLSCTHLVDLPPHSPLWHFFEHLMSVVAAMLFVCHGRCCCSGPWPLLLFSTSYIQCSTAAALLPAARMPSPVEVLAPVAAAARIGATVGSGELASATAVTRGRGELRPGRCRRRERGLGGAHP
jgi:hypothetical protein